MKKLSSILALVIVVCVVLSMSAFAADVTWKDYQDYLVEAAGGNAPDLDEFKGQVAAIGSWDEMPLDESPWDQFFTTLGLSTWDEFVAAGGVGKQSQVSGTASGEASDEAQSVEDAFIEYIHEWLIAEDEINDTMTEEVRENEFMPLVRQMDFETYPADMIYNGMLEQGVPMTFEEFAAQYQPVSGEPSGEASGAPSGEAS